MPEMDGDFGEVIATLRDARQAVARELESFSKHPFLDRRSLVVLDESVRGFATQADALIVMMAERDAANDLVDAAEELVDFFQRARQRIVSMLAVGQG